MVWQAENHPHLTPINIAPNETKLSCPPVTKLLVPPVPLCLTRADAFAKIAAAAPAACREESATVLATNPYHLRLPYA